MNIILVTGSKISKGIVVGSIGKIVQANGNHVTVIRMDSCWNEDSAYLNVAKYGEKYVLQDGTVVGVIFGNFERILDQVFTSKNNITRGKINDFVKRNIARFKGDKIYAETTVVQVTLEWIKEVFDQKIDGENIPNVCIIDFSGMNDPEFLKALKELSIDNPLIHIHCSKIEMGKCDSIQKSVENLRNCEWPPDMIICRSEEPLTDNFKEKDKGYALLKDEIINLPDVSNIKSVVIWLHEQNIYKLIAEKLQLENGPNCEVTMNELRQTIAKEANFKNVVEIALIGKYFKHADNSFFFQESYESMIQQLRIAAVDKKCGCQVKITFIWAQDLEKSAKPKDRCEAWALLKKADGILIPAGLKEDGFKGMMEACQHARENKIPCLSICYGFQCAVIEIAQNVLGVKDTRPYSKVLNSEVLENEETRSGLRTVYYLTKSKLFELYGSKPEIQERNFHRDEINPLYVPQLVRRAGVKFVAVGLDEDGNGNFSKKSEILKDIFRTHDESDEEGYVKTIEKLCSKSLETGVPIRMQAMELKDHPYFVGVQYHAKCGLRPSQASPPFVGLLLAARRRKEEMEQ
uniref:CTP synthase n=1 Tax=Panagrolaimus sp. ES5 TaxID=591445 RepID=A0AC34F5B1_9BILA